MANDDVEYSLCESVHATSYSNWHIRELTDKGKFLGGGVDTPGLCGIPKVRNGWDLEVPIDEHHLTKSTCKRCRAIYITRKLEELMDEYDDALCARKHGDVAANHLASQVRRLLGLEGFERRRKVQK